MRTQILPSNEIPVMSGDLMRRAIAQALHAYEAGDRALIERVIADDFSFTSPHDDAISRDDYFRRCWPNNETTARMKLERVIVDGEAAYVTYLGANTSGQSFRNTEYMTFRGSQIASIEVYFGPEYNDAGAMLQRSPPA